MFKSIVLLFALVTSLSGCGKTEAPVELRKEVEIVQPAIELTTEEKAYIAANTLSVGFPRRGPPMSWLSDDGPKGIAIDYLKAVSASTGLKLRYVPYDTQAANIDAFKAGVNDIASHVKKVPDREPFMSFTQPYIVLSVVMLIHDLPIKFPVVVGYAGKYPIQAMLERNAGGMVLKPFPTDDDSMNAMTKNEIGAMVIDVTTADFLERKYNVKYIRSPVDFSYDLAFGYQKNNAILGSILSKGLSNMSSLERAKIFSANTN